MAAVARQPKNSPPGYSKRIKHVKDCPPPPAKKKQSNPSSKPEENVPRNEAGVQLLSKPLRDQIFRNVAFEKIPREFVNVSHKHLKKHKLDVTKAQKLPHYDFVLPELQGENLDQHFWNVGEKLARRSKDLASNFARELLPDQPSKHQWSRVSGWTQYTRDETGALLENKGVGPDNENMLVFDVETMPAYHHYAVLACAASPTAWYVWISPWLLGETEDPEHLIPLGRPSGDGRKPEERVVIGHNVAYDRARVKEEYDLTKLSGIRWIDTMSLHVAIKGISSVQRPAWMAFKKEKERSDEVEVDDDLLDQDPLSEARLAQDLRRETEHRRAIKYEETTEMDPDEPPDVEAKRWEEVTSVNSLLEVAKLHCGITIDKETRNAFMEDTPEQILADLESFIDYCATDVSTTHAVFRAVLPQFFDACPHPVSWAGVMQMGSSFLTVNQEWEKYLTQAEKKYRDLETGVKTRLIDLAERARLLMEGGEWKKDVFLSQLDWTPKVAGKSRGYWVPTKKELSAMTPPPAKKGTMKEKRENKVHKSSEEDGWDYEMPNWFNILRQNPLSHESRHRIIPVVLQAKWLGRLMFYHPKRGWVYRISKSQVPEADKKGIVKLRHDDPLKEFEISGAVFVQPQKLRDIGTDEPFWSSKVARVLLQQGVITTDDDELGRALSSSTVIKRRKEQLLALAKEVTTGRKTFSRKQLDWTKKKRPSQLASSTGAREAKRVKSKDLHPEVEAAFDTTASDTTQIGHVTPPEGLKYPAPTWPKWYWELTKPRKGAPAGSPDITVRTRISPILLRLGWLGNPLVYSREHGWCYRIAPASSSQSSIKEGEGENKALDASNGDGSPTEDTTLFFNHPDDAHLAEQATEGYTFRKLPHPHGQEANVGNPLSKSFVKYAQDGTMKTIVDTSTTNETEPGVAGDTEQVVNGAINALDMNAQCSYWISARDRILSQMVVWEKEHGQLGIGKHLKRPQDANPKQDGVASPLPTESAGTLEGGKLPEKWGMILPQVITMGTVTRRAIEKTWLTASNAKKNRVGSELKAMVRAPPGYAIVGADVDSEELWISSVMGDAQFGFHGATAIGWMTLEGTKKDGTDLHSKTASILNITRDSAKVFNYSRIYGAGMRHAVQLLLQANAGMSIGEAQSLAEKLYLNTKGKKNYHTKYFGRSFWYGGTESYLFNKLEAIAHSDSPMTPALGCGVTTALSRKYLTEGFGTDYLPSRINWVVQSSGVDYLHLLLSATQHLIETYSINARYMISVHDEVRYLVADEDKYRLAMALQIANLWTRCLFAYRLGLDDLPVGVGFFSAVDIDIVLRKEVDMPCVTPSHPEALPPGESVGIGEVLEKTNNGSLLPDGGPMNVWTERTEEPPATEGYIEPDVKQHRAECLEFLEAQFTDQVHNLERLSCRWAQRLVEAGRGNEVRAWGKQRSAKWMDTKKRDVGSVGEAVGVDDEYVSAETLDEAFESTF